MIDGGNQCNTRLLLSPSILFPCITDLSPSLSIQLIWFLRINNAFFSFLSPPLSAYGSFHPFPAATSLSLYFSVIFSLCSILPRAPFFSVTLSCAFKNNDYSTFLGYFFLNVKSLEKNPKHFWCTISVFSLQCSKKVWSWEMGFT